MRRREKKGWFSLLQLYWCYFFCPDLGSIETLDWTRKSSWYLCDSVQEDVLVFVVSVLDATLPVNIWYLKATQCFKLQLWKYFNLGNIYISTAKPQPRLAYDTDHLKCSYRVQNCRQYKSYLDDLRCYFKVNYFYRWSF